MLDFPWTHLRKMGSDERELQDGDGPPIFLPDFGRADTVRQKSRSDLRQHFMLQAGTPSIGGSLHSERSLGILETRPSVGDRLLAIRRESSWRRPRLLHDKQG